MMVYAWEQTSFRLAIVGAPPRRDGTPLLPRRLRVVSGPARAREHDRPAAARDFGLASPLVHIGYAPISQGPLGADSREAREKAAKCVVQYVRTYTAPFRCGSGRPRHFVTGNFSPVAVPYTSFCTRSPYSAAMGHTPPVRL